MKRRFPANRIVVALEPRSNTMKMGVHADTLARSLEAADLMFVYRPEGMENTLDASLAGLGDRCSLYATYDELVDAMAAATRAGDQVIFMSNGGFGAARQKLTMALQARRMP
jgi:UDP-N-acetylmuramate: L-alanyl-gamma-D-glutamyl-meso-diaminopimelate ligase